MTADGGCAGSGNPFLWSVGWTQEEAQWASTCGNLGAREMKDALGDGACVEFYSKD